MKRGSNGTAQTKQAAGSATRARPALSAAQIAAIYGAMRTFRDDDLARTPDAGTIACLRCGRSRPAAGSLLYGGARLCNGCATDYELLRMAGLERDLLHPQP
ncbi:MAG TPA: hypothetical protein VFD32_13230 [Dehalococcoidia bacterium]|nr:hypothetical protein [Dehalococcoidia bacterium]